MPPWQVSVPLQRFASAQEVPFVTGMFLQPVAGSQESVVQELLSLQFGAAPATQLPFEHVSFPLQKFPSGQAVPLARFVCVQPRVMSQASVVQGFRSSQSSGAPGMQKPPWQISAPLQRFPSEHDVPLATTVFEQPVIGLQASVVQGF